MKNIGIWRTLPPSIRKIVRAMKISVFLVLICTLQLSANVMLGQQVNIQSGEMSVREVFKELKTQTGTYFVFREKEVDAKLMVNADFSDISLEEALDEICEQASLQYEIVDDYVLITKKAPVIEPTVEQEKIELKGKVTDKNGIPLPGVSVVIKGTSTGVATDIDGNYSLEIENSNAVLVFSFVGMMSQEVNYNGQVIQNITLSADTEGLEEVVVVGYGTQKRERIGSAISEVKSEEIELKSVGVSGFEQMIGGNIKGVQISQTSGAPGSASVVRVRGVTSPFSGGNNQPLYVIDGVPFNTDAEFGGGIYFGGAQNPLESINPTDIESLTVLKDAGATAIYGSRGANGVILITTKKGKKNSKMNVTFDASMSISNPSNTIDVLNAEGFKQLHQMIANNTLSAIANGNTGLNADMANTIVDGNGNLKNTYSYFGEEFSLWGDGDTDWQDEVYRKNALVQKYSINVNGGNEKTTYSASLSYMDQEALMINEYLKRYSGRLNLDSDLTKWMKFGSSMTFSGSKNFVGRNTSSGYGTPSEAIVGRPDIPVYAENGLLNKFPTSWSFLAGNNVSYNALEASPVGSMQKENEIKSITFFGNAFLEIQPIKDLKLRGDLSTSYFNTDGNDFAPKATKYLNIYDPNSAQSSLNVSHSRSLTTSLSFRANYNKTIAELHTIDAMLGVSWDRANYDQQYYYFNDLADDEVLNNPQSGKFVESSGNKAISGVNSVFSRIQYSYNGRYTLTLNMRSDASSKFGPGNERGYFPSAAVNWNVTEEKFLQGQDVIDNLKLRTSYGKTGSANIADFAYLKTFGVGFRSDGVYMGGTAINPSGVFPNRNIKWETTKELNAGVDFALFKNRLRGSVDWYEKNTDGALIPSPIYREGGATSYTDNRAEISNKGMEFELGGDIIRTKDWVWSLSVNIAFNRNKIESLKGGELPWYLASQYIEGEPVGTILGYEVEKIFDNQEEISQLNSNSPVGYYHGASRGVGDYKYRDINQDGRINSEDKTVLGSMQPDYFGGFSTAIQYKNISLTAGFQYSVGNEKSWANYGSVIGSAAFLKNKGKEALTDTWREDNQSAKYTRLVYGGASNTLTSDRTIQDASYLRLKVVNLNYNLPKSVTDKLGIAGASVYVAGTNLLTITKFKGLDPEGSGGTYSIGSTGSITGEASSRDAYPFATTYSAGIKVRF